LAVIDYKDHLERYAGIANLLAVLGEDLSQITTAFYDGNDDREIDC
jgi:hypothetical protein